MEPEYENPNSGGSLYVSMSGDLSDERYLKSQLNLVVDQLKAKGVTPSLMKHKCEDYNVSTSCYGTSDRAHREIWI